MASSVATAVPNRWVGRSNSRISQQEQEPRPRRVSVDRRRRRAASAREPHAISVCSTLYGGSVCDLCVGSVVRLRGLQRWPQYNGSTGRLLTWEDEIGRWLVELDDGGRHHLLSEHLMAIPVRQQPPRRIWRSQHKTASESAAFSQERLATDAQTTAKLVDLLEYVLRSRVGVSEDVPMHAKDIRSDVQHEKVDKRRVSEATSQTSAGRSTSVAESQWDETENGEVDKASSLFSLPFTPRPEEGFRRAPLEAQRLQEILNKWDAEDDSLPLPPTSDSWDWPMSRHEKKARVLQFDALTRQSEHQDVRERILGTRAAFEASRQSSV